MQYLATLGQQLCLGKIIGAGAAARIEQKLQLLEQVIYQLGTIHLRCQHVLGGEGCPHVPTFKRSQYIRIKNPIHKNFAGMSMVGG